eukprot:COSAG02_NODE_1002_length_15290_cov_16.085314_9_plen_71_part_00
MELQPLPVADLGAPAATEDTDGPWRAAYPSFGKSFDDGDWSLYVLWRLTLMLKILTKILTGDLTGGGDLS